MYCNACEFWIQQSPYTGHTSSTLYVALSNVIDILGKRLGFEPTFYLHSNSRYTERYHVGIT